MIAIRQLTETGFGLQACSRFEFSIPKSGEIPPRLIQI